MPTNLLRKRDPKPAAGAAQKSKPAKPKSGGKRYAKLKAGKIVILLELLKTPTADRVWLQLPLYSTADLWGAALFFETPVESGRERAARLLAEPGDVCFWVEEDRVLIPYGRTPVSRPGELRLPSPCNVWAKALDDVTLLKDVAPGEKVTMTKV